MTSLFLGPFETYLSESLITSASITHRLCRAFVLESHELKEELIAEPGLQDKYSTEKRLGQVGTLFAVFLTPSYLVGFGLELADHVLNPRLFVGPWRSKILEVDLGPLPRYRLAQSEGIPTTTWIVDRDLHFLFRLQPGNVPLYQYLVRALCFL